MADKVIRQLIIARMRDDFTFWTFGKDGTQDLECLTNLYSEFRSMLNEDAMRLFDDECMDIDDGRTL